MSTASALSSEGQPWWLVVAVPARTSLLRGANRLLSAVDEPPVRHDGPTVPQQEAVDAPWGVNSAQAERRRLWLRYQMAS